MRLTQCRQAFETSSVGDLLFPPTPPATRLFSSPLSWSGPGCDRSDLTRTQHCSAASTEQERPRQTCRAGEPEHQNVSQGTTIDSALSPHVPSSRLVVRRKLTSSLQTTSSTYRWCDSQHSNSFLSRICRPSLLTFTFERHLHLVFSIPFHWHYLDIAFIHSLIQLFFSASGALFHNLGFRVGQHHHGDTQ